MAEPCVDQPLIDVLAVRGIPLPPAGETLQSRPHDIGKEEPEAQNQEERALLARARGQKQGQSSESVTQNTTSDVSHEDGRGRPVLQQEATATAGDRQGDRGSQVVGQDEAESETRDGSLQAGDAVDSVHEVVGIRDDQQPQDGRRRRGDAQRQIERVRQRQPLQPAGCRHHDQSGGQLGGELDADGEAGPIVPKASRRQERGSGEQCHVARPR